MGADQEETRLGEYAIDGVLGEGGFGIVYAARRGEQPLALKVLRAELDLSDSERARFLKEAEILGSLDHPSIVALVDHGVLDDGRPFIAMELLAGDVLVDRLGDAPLSYREALRLFGQLAEAVAAVHDAGLVHRDIKPENIMLVDDDARAVLLDLGIAKGVAEAPSTTTQAGRVRGTPAYMAPERFYGTPASARTDLYELALVLYMMLLGRLPWTDAADPAARHHPVPPVNAGFSKALSDVLLDALSVDAKRRPISVRALARAVDRAGEGQLAPALGNVTTAAQPFVELPPAGPPDGPRVPPSPGAVTPDTTPAPASALIVRQANPPRWRAPLVAAVAAAGVATLPWLWITRGVGERIEAAASAPPVATVDAEPTPLADAQSAVPEATAIVADAPVPPAPHSAEPHSPAPHSAAAHSPAPHSPAPHSPAPHSHQPLGDRAVPRVPTSTEPLAVLPGGAVVVPLGPKGAPPPPAPWCDRYIALRCAPDARKWSPSGCATAKSVVARNGELFARLPDKSGHDRICKNQYAAEKAHVEEGIAAMKAREQRAAEAPQSSSSNSDATKRSRSSESGAK